LTIEGVDMLNDTPLFDIKPYVPYSDLAENAIAGYADTKPMSKLSVACQEGALSSLQAYTKDYANLARTIEIVLEADPRPAYKEKQVDSKLYTVRLFDLDIAFKVENNQAVVIQIQQIQ
jgi:hypothetical protein